MMIKIGTTYVKEFENKIREFRLQKNWSQKKMAELAGININSISRYEIGFSSLFRAQKPIRQNDVALKICKILKKEPEEIFTREICILKGTYLTYEQTLNCLNGENIKNGEDQYIQYEMQFAIKNMLKTLPKRIMEVITLRFYHDKSLEEIGHMYNLSRTRIQQLESKGLRLLRHPERSRKLKYYYEK